MQVALQVQKRAQSPPYKLLVYHGQGCAGNGRGDHVMIMPAYNSNAHVIEMMVSSLVAAVRDVFDELDRALS
jgi:hypothetical protein